MPPPLPTPQVLRSYFDDQFEPRLPVTCLRWQEDPSEEADAVAWDLPGGVRLEGPPPRCFGWGVHRHGPDAYAVRMLWDRTGFTWASLTRAELLRTALVPLLAALGTDLANLLDQPVRPQRRPRPGAA
jgi:hypothetical protein